MQNPSQTEAISRFLREFTYSDLSSLYNDGMEVQVNVAQDDGVRVKGEYRGKNWNAWTDGIQTWKPIRIPYKANTSPEYDDKEMKFDLVEHAEGIGLSGWNWKRKVSCWVAFDFDAITGHSDKHSRKLTPEQLREIEKLVSDIPWVTLRRSTSGSGLHLYVFLPDVPTKTHTEHAALARAVLGLLSANVGYDFQSKVDVCGHIMWIWHRKMKGTQGLTLLKTGTILADVPSNWMDHVAVVSGRKKRVMPDFVEKVENTFEELAGQRPKIELDADHKALIQYLKDHEASWWWDQDRHMLVAHTFDLKRAFDDLQMRGIFETISVGTEAGADHNCFCFPLQKGGWVIRRFSIGVAEAKTWIQDANGWTTCYLNRVPDLLTAARAFSGVEDVKGGFIFNEASCALEAAQLVGIAVTIPPRMNGRQAKLKEHKDGRLVIEIEAQPGDTGMEDWLLDKKVWRRIQNQKVVTRYESEVGNVDEFVRHIVTVSGEDCGWSLRNEFGWRREPFVHVKTYLASLGNGPRDVTNILGTCIERCWTIVSLPFQPEYPGDRKWNCSGAQFRFPVVEDEELTHPTWDRILKHTGGGLDEAVLVDEWAKSNGIMTGGDYLKCWLASMVQEPNEPLPYLFFYGPQVSGKSILHEACDLLISNGIERGDIAVISDSGFNAELEGKVLCIIEETDLGGSKGRTSYNRIKDWVTAPKVQIHPKRQTPYTAINTTHWMQCANSMESCPVFPGDSRITVCYVPKLSDQEMIPKKVLMGMLEKEAPHFLTSLVRFDLPTCVDRLNIPVITTQEKIEAEKSNRNMLEIFIEEKCHYIPGCRIKYSDFYQAFKEWIDPSLVHQWSQIRTGKELPRGKHPKGRGVDCQYYVCNISFNPAAEEGKILYVVNDKITEAP